MREEIMSEFVFNFFISQKSKENMRKLEMNTINREIK